MRILQKLFAISCVFGLMGTGLTAQLARAAPAALTATTITINSTDDPGPTSLTATCGYTGGVFVAASDGKCTLRRAILEASARPQAQRPISITFSIPATDTNHALEVPGTWTIQVLAALPTLKTDTIINLNGQTTIDGSTQPGGRSDGPSIIVDTHDNSLEVESTFNIIRNLSWKGGGTIFLKKNSNLVENLWMGLTDDGQRLHLRTPGDPKRLALGGGVYVLAADNNVVRKNVISGAFARAIDIQGTNNIITGNLIGTRADGSVPDVAEGIKCIASFDYDESNWYGGWGIQMSGTSNTLANNRIVGLNNLRSANETVPLTIEFAGNNHQIKNNIIGVDVNGKEFGVCGQAIFAAGNGTQILDNTIVRSGHSFEGDPGSYVDAAIMTSDTSPTFGRITIRRNIVKDILGKVYDFGPGIPTTLKEFYPSSIKQINGLTVLGSSGYNSPCPNCIVDLYTDDDDVYQEALSHVGSATADAAGVFTYTLSAPLPAGTYLRTMSTVQSAGVIGTLGSGTSTRMSALARAPISTTITGPISGTINNTYAYTITANPIALALPLTITIEATDFANSQFISTNSVFLGSLRWTNNGPKVITITLTNEMGSTNSTFNVQIGPNERKVYLPMLRK